MITDYSREQIQKIVNDGIAPVQALRDYDVIKAKMEGKNAEHIAEDNRISRAQVYNVINKYMRRVV
jgi:Mor family transcriptional regulator